MLAPLLPCIEIHFPGPFLMCILLGKPFLYGREVVTVCRNDSSPRRQTDRLAYGKRPRGLKSGVDTRATPPNPQPPTLSWRSRDHGERSAPALAWAQPLFEFERHCILLDSCSGQTCQPPSDAEGSSASLRDWVLLCPLGLS